MAKITVKKEMTPEDFAEWREYIRGRGSISREKFFEMPDMKDSYIFLTCPHCDETIEMNTLDDDFYEEVKQ